MPTHALPLGGDRTTPEMLGKLRTPARSSPCIGNPSPTSARVSAVEGIKGLGDYSFTYEYLSHVTQLNTQTYSVPARGPPALACAGLCGPALAAPAGRPATWTRDHSLSLPQLCSTLFRARLSGRARAAAQRPRERPASWTRARLQALARRPSSAARPPPQRPRPR